MTEDGEELSEPVVSCTQLSADQPISLAAVNPQSISVLQHFLAVKAETRRRTGVATQKAAHTGSAGPRRDSVCLRRPCFQFRLFLYSKAAKCVFNYYKRRGVTPVHLVIDGLGNFKK